MARKDIAQITVIDKEAFPTMWPPVNFQHELQNRLAHYIVACDGTKEPDIVQPPAIKLVPVRSFLGVKWPFNPRRPEPPSEPVEYILGFVGLWLMVDEAHIINIAVRECHRGNGIGELLLISSIDLASQLKARVVTLEVRASNTVAQNLYSKYGFEKVGVRKGYYTDNREDAFIMTTDLISSNGYRKRFLELKQNHFKKLTELEYRIPS